MHYIPIVLILLITMASPLWAVTAGVIAQKPPVVTSPIQPTNLKPTHPKAVKLPTLLPHRAYYGVRLARAPDPETGIVDARGWMTMNISQAEEGYTLEQRSNLFVYYEDGAEQLNTTIVTYESADGKNYRFRGRIQKTGSLEEPLEESVHGQGRTTALEGPGTAEFFQPEAHKIDLPQGTLFPLTHMRYALGQFENKPLFLSNTVFDGTGQTFEPMEVSSIILPAKAPIKFNDPMLDLHAVTLKTSVYAPQVPGTAESGPDYTTEQTIFANGIIGRIKVDYGDLCLISDLEKLEYSTPEGEKSLQLSTSTPAYEADKTTPLKPHRSTKQRDLDCETA